MATKDFGAIADDYAFFMAHATEAVCDVAAYREQFAEFAQGRTSLRMLDFGCGTGAFSEQLLSALDWPPHLLQLTLVEPVAQQRDAAVQRLSKFSCATPSGWERLVPTHEIGFDVILSNHALYYVTDLSETLSRMCAALLPRGRMQLAIAGWDNVLLELWQIGFGLLNRSVPYYAAEDVAAWLAARSIAFRQFSVPYRLRFPDTSENRLRMLRFLFGEYLPEISPERLLPEFDRFAIDGHVDISTHSEHFAVDGP